MASNKSIHIVTNWLKQGGGAEKITVEIANALVKNAFKVSLTVLSSESADLKDKVNSSVDMSFISKFITFKTYIKLFFSVLKTRKNTIFFASNHRLAIILYLFKKMTFKRNLLIARNISNLTILMQNKPSYYLWILRKIYSKIDIVIAQSNGMKNDLIQNFHFKEEQVVVINNPIQVVGNQIVERKKFSKRKLLFIGRLGKEKGFDYILSAMEILKERKIDFILRIVGRGELHEMLNKKIRDLGLEQYIELLGFHKNLSEFYNECDVVILCSEYEGFPNVLIEANAFGKPVVSCDTPYGPSEIIIDGVNGFLSNYQDPKDLSEKINMSLNYRWEPKMIKKSAERFSYQTFEAKIISLFGREL